MATERPQSSSAPPPKERTEHSVTPPSIFARIQQRIRESGTVSRRDVLLFTKNLVVLIHAGSTLPEAIGVLRDQSKGRFRVVLTEIREHIERGFPMSDAVRRYPKIFSQIYRSIIDIGERSGTLEENLKYLAAQLERSDALRRQVLGALMYPIIVLGGTVTLSALVVLFVMPKVSRLFGSFQVKLPLPTRMLLAVSNFFELYGWWAIGSVIAGTMLITWVLRRPVVRPVTHWIVLHLPVVRTIARDANSAMFCRTLGVLLRTGTTIDDGLAACARTLPNVWYARAMANAHEQVRGGSSLADVLRQHQGLFSLTDVQILQVGESSGSLTDSLEYCAQVHEESLQSVTKALATILEPLILLVLGVMVATLALAVITPIYTITQQFRQ